MFLNKDSTTFCFNPIKYLLRFFYRKLVFAISMLSIFLVLVEFKKVNIMGMLICTLLITRATDLSLLIYK